MTHSPNDSTIENTSPQGVKFVDFFEDQAQLGHGEQYTNLDQTITNTDIQALAIDSRHIKAGILFFAIKGTAPAATQAEINAKMAGYIQSALTQGAALILSEVDAKTLGFSNEPRIVYLADLRQRIGGIARRFNQQIKPLANTTRVAAVTGTNGKTTVTRLLAEIWTHAGQLSAVMGTTGNGIVPNLTPSTHTTVDALLLQNKLHDYAAQGATLACLEASSHGLEQGRLAGTPIEVAIFTNLTRDHLDYHGTFEAYAEAKSRLFNPHYFPDLKYAIVNADDPTSSLMLEHFPQDAVVWRYSMQSVADFYILKSAFTLNGATLEVQTPFGVVTLQSPLLGRFNVANLLAAVAGALALGLSLLEVLAAVPHLIGAAGRMQVIADDSLLLIVDYAHTPDALTQVLTSLRPHVDGKLTCVFGCGGDRDRGKRPLMTRAALNDADRLIVTSDNPRSEATEAIIADMLRDLTADELQRITVVPDRRQAILHAVRDSKTGDAIVLAGKGHENYQEIEGVRHWFDDAVELAQARAALQTLPVTTDADLKR
ncbi:MAG: UDP-N-acetylmuramoyl-L-alanyl-D-glutamate--2,6-diaminopimelate ligase [Candidatus Saccharibacteria bacterium]|nr:UDP-N-acetylmuramoyl-L-alanyl-D-glutamate--2,6-diaminopimelate ligase [Moraxellaceae bacterium]